MSDVRTVWDADLLQGDWLFTAGDLDTGRDLETAAILSLFTDGLAQADDRLPDPADGDRRGWWADWEAPEGPLGSRLWLLSREVATEAVRLRAEDYCREALRWMIDDGVADRIDITATWLGAVPGRLDVAVTIMRERAVLLHRSFSWAWRQVLPFLRAVA